MITFAEPLESLIIQSMSQGYAVPSSPITPHSSSPITPNTGYTDFLSIAFNPHQFMTSPAEEKRLPVPTTIHKDVLPTPGTWLRDCSELKLTPFSHTEVNPFEGSFASVTKNNQTSDTASAEYLKRKKMLDRNREAAVKSREKKKRWVQDLENNLDKLKGENVALKARVGTLQNDLAVLKAQLNTHTRPSCSCGLTRK